MVAFSKISMMAGAVAAQHSRVEDGDDSIMIQTKSEMVAETAVKHDACTGSHAKKVENCVKDNADKNRLAKCLKDAFGLKDGDTFTGECLISLMGHSKRCNPHHISSSTMSRSRERTVGVNSIYCSEMLQHKFGFNSQNNNHKMAFDQFAGMSHEWMALPVLSDEDLHDKIGSK